MCCEANSDLQDLDSSLVFCSALAVAFALGERGLFTKDTIVNALCSRHKKWFLQEFKTMADNAPVQS